MNYVARQMSMNLKDKQIRIYFVSEMTCRLFGSWDNTFRLNNFLVARITVLKQHLNDKDWVLDRTPGCEERR